MNNRRNLLALLCGTLTCAGLAQTMVTKHLSDFATPGGGGYPNDSINDHQAFVDAAAFFQANNGNGTLILGDGEYIMGAQQFHPAGSPPLGAGWEAAQYPDGYPCQSAVANQKGFVLDSCSNFTVQGGANTKVRYRDCLYYGTFVRDPLTGAVSSAVEAQDTTLFEETIIEGDTIITPVTLSRCITCGEKWHMPQYLNLNLLHARVGIMFTFRHCDSITVRDVELDGNIDAAILGGKALWDGMQTDYDGVMLWESSRSLLENVNAHHFGRDGLLISSGYNGPASAFIQQHPNLFMTIDTDSSETLNFNNTIKHSRFEWNGRQGLSWTGCAGLVAIDCDFNYTAAGRMNSSMGVGLDLEGGGGPMRVRHGVFDDCRFLHNRGAGIHADSGPCHGQQDFRFNNCVVKAGEDANALWANSRGMKFTDCQIYGRVANLFEQAENIPYDPDYNLLFLRTDFREEDDDWSYVFVDSTQWSTQCIGNTTHKLDLVAPDAVTARVTFDSCGFYTNCYGKIRMVGRTIQGNQFPRCQTCIHCGTPADSSCAPGACATQGPFGGPPGSPPDARFIKATDCYFKNTGRRRCVTPPENPFATELISVDLTTVVNFQLDVPNVVRDAVSPFDVYATNFGVSGVLWGLPPGCLGYCTDWDTIQTNYDEGFPPCKPNYHWPDSIVRWAYCNPAGNLPTTPCGSYTLSKTATPTTTQPDSTVTYTIAVCNNTVYATPVLLSEQLPPAFTATSATAWIGADTLAWSTADTTLTLNNGQCAQFVITGHFTAFGEFTNTVTLDTDTAAGPEHSASATVNVVSACAAEHIIPDGALASVVGSVYSSTTVTIMGQFIVDDDVLFQSCQVFMEAGAEIVVLPGFTLDVMSSSVVSCRQIMWKGITAQGGSTVRMRGSFVDDAENAITALDGSTLWLRDNQFHNNRVTLHVPEMEGVPWNNVAAYIRGNTFYSQGPMPQPYPGQATAVGAVGFAAFDVDWMVLDLTDGNNLIHTMSNGIVARNSDVRVADCRMLAIQPDAAYAYTGNGAGIYAFGGMGWHTLEQEGFGMGYTPSFEDCRWGIYTEYMNVSSTDNRMLDMGTAYRIDRSGNRMVDILRNQVECKYHGMDLRFNDGASHVLIADNDITFGNDTVCVLCKGYSGIQVSEANAANPNSVIQSNTLRFVPLTPSRFGVHLLSASDWLVQGNQVVMASQNSRTGIRTSGCQRVQVNCNEVTNADPLYAQYASEAQAGMRNWLGQDLLFSCNSVDRTTSGMLFSGGLSNTELRGNEFHQHRWGLHLENAVIGEQEHRGNLWFDPAPMNGFQAVCVPPENAVFSPFMVDPALSPSGGSLLPASISPPIGWFFPATGQTFSCDDESECAGFKERCATCADSLWRKVADGTVENAAYTPETRWIMKGDLYKLLTEEPERLQGDGLLQAFYAEVEADVLAQLKDLEAEQLALYQLDASVLDALEQGAVQLAALRAQLQVEVAALGDSSLSATQLQAHAQAILGLQAGMAALLGYHGQALELAATGRALTAESVKATNSAIAAGTLIEVNHKAVNEVYLSTVAKDTDVFTPEQAAVLFAVADQCPLTGGNAVFRARALYSLIDDAQEYDDALLCLQEGLITKRLEEAVASACTVVPNPAREQATLVLSAPLTTPAWLVLTSALVAEVKRVQVPAEQMRTAFSIQGLAPGIYHYTLLNHHGAIGGGRLAIER